MEVLVLVEEHGADAAFRAGNAFNHGEHHPAHGGILAECFEGFIGLAENDNFVDDAPFAHAEGAPEIEFFFGDGGHDFGHAGNEEYRDRENEQIKFEFVAGGSHEGEEKR